MGLYYLWLTKTMNTDLTFITIEPGSTLLDRFRKNPRAVLAGLYRIVVFLSFNACKKYHVE